MPPYFCIWREMTVKNPSITLGDKIFEAPNVTPRIWREVMKTRTELPNMTDEQLCDAILNLIVLAFRNSEITFERLDNELDGALIWPTYQSIVLWVNAVVMGKAEKLPNAQTPATE